MTDFSYSPEALEAKAAFYNKDFTIYVEGKDDILFWDNICRYANIVNYHIEDVGGEAIEKYKKILRDNLQVDFIVACDLNFDSLIYGKYKKQTKKIVYTYGHSIENSMYNLIEKIDRAIKKLSRTQESFRTKIIEAFKELIEKIRFLIYYDVANEMFDKSISVLTNSCNCYLTGKNSYHLDDSLINEKIFFVKNKFSEDEVNFARERIIKSKKSLWFLIRGHFLTTWIYKLIKYLSEKFTGTKLSLSFDTLYTEFIDCPKNQQDIIYCVRNLKRGKQLLY